MEFHDKWHVAHSEFNLANYRKFVVCADIGGTNARMAIFGLNKKRVEQLVTRVALTKDITSQEDLKDIVNDFLREVNESHGICVSEGAFSLAGPISHDRAECRLTNRPLKIEVSHFLENTALSELLFLNDVEAASYSIDQLPKTSLKKINDAEPDHEGVRAFIYPGTGLGIGFSIFDRQIGYHRPYPSEGGHCDAVFDDATKEYVRKNIMKVPDQESAISGPGLVNTYMALTPTAKRKKEIIESSEEMMPRTITKEAIEGDDIYCKKAVAQFILNLAGHAKNTALCTMCYGGLYLIGGIVEELESFIRDRNFWKEFTNIEKKSMKEFLEGVPVIVINQRDMPLIGAAHAACFFMELTYKHHRPKRVSYDDVINQHMKILKSLQHKSGLFSASYHDIKTGYDKAWLRDNFYECLAFEEIGDWETVRRTYRAILDIFKKHEYKIDWAIKEKPDASYKYIHARYNPDTFDEYWEEWGNKQNDSIGCILFKIGELEHVKGIKILEDEDDRRIVQKLVYYLDSIHFWCDEDNGLWENDEEVHASSIGACVAGLKMIRKYTDIDVPEHMIKQGEHALRNLLPRESGHRFVDLSLLSLIYPYDVATEKEKDAILKNVEYHLVKNKGVVRYRNDWYYNKNPDGFSEEAEWTMGLSWLAIIYKKLGNKEKADYYEKKAMETISQQGGIPELYFSNTSKYNENNPLGWSESMLVVSLFEINKKHV